MSFSIGHFFLDNYISWRQYRVLCQTKVPKALEAEIDQKTYDKSQVGSHYQEMFSLLILICVLRLTDVPKQSLV